MSDNLPMEIQIEIMKKLPVKSLIKFRSVSKPWKSIIDSSGFVTSHHTQQQHIIVTSIQAWDGNPSYVSIADDHHMTFPQKLYPPIPLLLQRLTHSTVIGSDRGLLCIHGTSLSETTDVAVIWNISIRRAIPVTLPVVVDRMYGTCIGFGVCPTTIDPKIVKIAYIKNRSDMEKISYIPSQVEVFTLSTEVWRSLYKNLPRKSIQFLWLEKREVVDGFIYWRAIDRTRTNMARGYSSYNLIISFDITTEEFREVNLPCSLKHGSISDYSMSKLRESLVVFHCGVEANYSVIDVWVMEDGVSSLFTKLYTINVNILNARVNTLNARLNTQSARVNTPKARVKGFRKSGEPIIEILEDDLPTYELVTYDPYSKHIDYLRIKGIGTMFSVYPYMETLLLLDQPNLVAYDVREPIGYLDDFVL